MWKEKVNTYKLLVFCKTPRTRKEIMKKFELTPIEGWHCCKYMMKLRSDIIVQKNVGITNKAYLYQTRRVSLEGIIQEKGKEEYDKYVEELL